MFLKKSQNFLFSLSIGSQREGAIFAEIRKFLKNFFGCNFASIRAEVQALQFISPQVVATEKAPKGQHFRKFLEKFFRQKEKAAIAAW